MTMARNFKYLLCFSLILIFASCKDAKINVKMKTSGKTQYKASGQNPINTSSVGAFAGKTVGNNYTVQIKVGGAAIPSTLTNSGTGNYRVFTKVVAQ